MPFKKFFVYDATWDWTQVSRTIGKHSRTIGKHSTHYSSDSQLKKKICRIVNFVVQADHSVKINESEKKTFKKYMKVTVIPIVIGALGTIPKGLVKGLEDIEIKEQVEPIQTTAFLRSAKILLKSLGDLKRLTVTQISLWNYQLTVVRKALKRVK